MADAKVSGTITVGDAGAPSVTQPVDITVSNVGSSGKIFKKYLAAPTNDVILAAGANELIPATKFVKFLRLKFMDAAGALVLATVRLNAISLPPCTELIFTVNAGTSNITNVDITSTTANLVVEGIYASD